MYFDCFILINALICCDTKNKTPKRYPVIGTSFRCSFTHCSLLFEAGASIPEVKERLGHSDIKTTINTYTHVTKKTKDETAQ
ncbi:hypothetical protein CI088_01910 [Enterococcus plantarum]|uniref:Tyr recombinase domain-containing protein n=1 Tax=Enterococcus plantarum TaxID=1077675 RepID=A0A2W4BUZ0_9ENTE|nr:hypothetical protein CI088_01910 [Enterococcus plantarum]